MNEQETDANTLLQQLQKVSAEDFEHLISDVWEYLGYNTEVTKYSADKGIDVIATREFPYNEKILIQAKRYSSGSTVSSPEMQKYGSLARRDRVDSVVVVSTGGFTKEALEVADDYNIKCINGSELAHLLIIEGIEELVSSYVDKEYSAEIEQKYSPDTPSSIKQESKTTVGEGKYLKIEIRGYEYVPHLECLVVALEITNKSSYEWEVDGRNGFAVISTEGYSYTGAKMADNIDPWQPLNGSGKVKVKRNSTARVALFYQTHEEIDIHRIEFETKVWRDHGGKSLDTNRKEKERITIPLAESIRDEVNSLPDSLSTGSARLPFPDQ